MRRSGTRLSDSQDMQFLESDNPGPSETDSEVRKILTLHIPITEYDLGSESDNECSAKSLKKYTSHRGL